jgi:hypothetical protein
MGEHRRDEVCLAIQLQRTCNMPASYAMPSQLVGSVWQPSAGANGGSDR